MTKESIKTFGSSVPIGRPGQPVEVATCFVFLASADSSYIRYELDPFNFQLSSLLRISAVKSYTSMVALSSTKPPVSHVEQSKCIDSL